MITNRLTHQSTTLTNKRRQWRTRAEHSRLKSGAPLMRGLDIHMNSPLSVTKLTLGLRVGFISSQLTTNKLLPVNPRAITGPPKMSLLLEAKSMPALIIKPRLILVTYEYILIGIQYDARLGGSESIQFHGISPLSQIHRRTVMLALLDCCQILIVHWTKHPSFNIGKQLIHILKCQTDLKFRQSPSKILTIPKVMMIRLS